MRITDEKINAYSASFEVGPSRHEYVGGGSGVGTSYYLFMLPKTTLSNVYVTTGYSDDPNSESIARFTESVKYNVYSSHHKLQSVYSAVDKIAVSNKSKIEFDAGLNEYDTLYFTDSRDNKYVIVKCVIRSVNTNFFVSVSYSTANAIIADSWFLLKNGEVQDLVCNTPLLIKPNHQQAISVGTEYTIQKPGIVYHVDSTFQPKIMVVNPGDVLKGGYLYYLLEIA